MEKRTLKIKEILLSVIEDAYNEEDIYVIMKILMNILENNESINMNLDLKTFDVVIYNALIKKVDEFSNKDFLDANYDDVSEDVIRLVKLHIARAKAKKFNLDMQSCDIINYKALF